MPFRLLCREYGAAVRVTEMVSAKGLLYRSPGTGQLLQSASGDAPLVVQLFGGEAESMGQAVLILLRHGYRYFDCNMGCPVRKVMRQQAGAALMANIDLALEIGKAMLAAAKVEIDNIPPAQVGFKLRLGPSRGDEALDLGKYLEDAGAGWLCLHPRTAAQGYGGEADWGEIARLAEAVNIPVIASGDLMDAEAGAACLAQTGAAAVMYARGALRDPSIFRQHRALLNGQAAEKPDHGQLLAIIRRHIELTRLYGGDGQAFRKIRSIIPRYARNLAGAHQLRQALSLCENWESLEEALMNFWRRREDL